MVIIVELDENYSNDSGMPASSLQLVVYSGGNLRQMDRRSSTSSTTDGAHLHEKDSTKMGKANNSTPPKDLQIVDATPLRVVRPCNQKTRRGKKAKGPFRDGKEIGLPDGWLYEKRERTNLNYKGKFDQFFYEPGTNKQFRSVKEVEKHLQSKGEKFNPITPQPLQQNDQLQHEAPPITNLTSENAGNSNPETHQKKRKRRIKFDYSNPPEGVTWVLTDAKKDKWTAFMGPDENVPEDTQQYWQKTFMSINKRKNLDRNKNVHWL